MLHVGATAVPGCLTKGDLDVVVRVEPADFAAAEARLAGRFGRNAGSVRTEDFAAFAEAGRSPPLGIQLTVKGGALDIFHAFAAALRGDPALVRRYNALKLRFRGRPMAVFFGFTHCPDVCPTTLGDMTALIEALGPGADRLHWLFVGVDWERDTPGTLAAYLEAFDRRIVGLSGTEAQVAAAARAFRVHHRRVPTEGGGYRMDHSASVFLLDAAGRPVSSDSNSARSTAAGLKRPSGRRFAWNGRLSAPGIWPATGSIGSTSPA